MDKNIKIALITGLLSLGGVLLGSVISGYFQTQSAEIDAGKSLRLGCIKNSLAREDYIRQATANFFSEFSDAIAIFSQPKSTDADFCRAYSNVQNAAFKLAAYAPPKLSTKTIGLSFSMLQALQVSSAEGRKAALLSAVKNAHDLPIEYEKEMKDFEKKRESCGK